MSGVAFPSLDPIDYRKGEIKTNTCVPTDHALIGHGIYGGVFGLGQIVGRGPLSRLKAKEFVVKKSLTSMDQEYAIGRRLSHPNLLPSLALFRKTYPANQKPNPANWGERAFNCSVDRKIYKLVMKRIKGKPISFYSNNFQFSRKEIQFLLTQAKSVSAYLLEEKISWYDLNSGNIYTPRD